jgi:hypothetical protein
MTDSQKMFGANVGFLMTQESVRERTQHESSAQLYRPVILSEAPRQLIPHEAEGRGVEGSLRCFGSPCCIKAFWRELPAAIFVMQTFPGSFDSPSSRKTGLGLTQDDIEKVHRYPLNLFPYNLNIMRLKQLHG